MRLFGVPGVVREQLTVFLESRSAARGVGDDGIEATVHHGIDVAAGQLARLIAHAGVQVQRAATALVFRDHHLAAVLLQYPNGSLIQPREAHVGDAPCKEGHAMPALAFRRKRAADLAEEKRRLGGGSQLHQVAQPSQQLQLSQPAGQGLEAAHLEQIQHGAGHRKGVARLQQADEDQVPQLAREPAAVRVRFQFHARIFHHAAVRHARGTGRFATAAGQAESDMFAVGIADGRTVGHLHHLIDAAARRIHLQAEFAIGGAGVQTQAAVYAAVQVELPGSQTGLFR